MVQQKATKTHIEEELYTLKYLFFCADFFHLMQHFPTVQPNLKAKFSQLPQFNLFVTFEWPQGGTVKHYHHLQPEP